jgi:hypothetical protein
MNYRKLDAALAGELEHAGDAAMLNVFIHTGDAINETQAAELAAHGVNIASPQQKIVTAAVGPKALDKISQLPWVSRIALARKLRPLRES